MKWNPLRWLWGLVPIAMLCWVAVLAERDRIEADLKNRAQTALTAAGLSWAGSTFNGRDAILTGQASDDAEPDQAFQKVLGTWGVRVVDNRAELLEKATPYTWSAVEAGNKLRLAGHVPNESTRKVVLASVKSAFPKHEVEDRMKLARGAPPRETWTGGVGFALKQLAQLKDGTAELEGTNLSIGGRADSTATYKAVRSALSGSLPNGFKLKSDKVTPPLVSPYLWSAKLENNQVTLAGYVPSEQQRTQLSNAVKAALPRSAIIDRMELAEGAPEGWAAAAQVAVRELGRLEEGTAELRATQLNVAGIATTDVIAESVKKALRERMPQAIKLSEAIKFKGPAIPTINPYKTFVEAGPQAVTLTGHAPSEAARTAIGETARARLPGRRIDNKLEIGNGAPNGWQSCMQFGLAGLGRLGGGKAAMTGGRLELTGETEDEALQRSLPGEIELAAAQACDTDVKISMREVPEPSLNWKATRSAANQVVLEGDVPDAATKADLAQAAAKLVPGVSVVDRMRVANVRPGRWGQAAETGLAQLTRLRFGSVDIKGNVLTVSGEAPDRSVVAAIQEQVTRRLPKGYNGQETVEVRTDGDIAAEEARRRAEADAKRKAEEEARRRQDMAAPEERKRMEDERRRADEEARKRAEQVAAESRQRAELARCQDTLKQVAAKGVILFERASADLNARSNATLDELARVMKQCPQGIIEIEGHTDIEGAPDRNQRLSERRAASVRAYLAGAGVDASRLVAIGYGQDKPIATNDTPEGRAKNRRIEFTVKAGR